MKYEIFVVLSVKLFTSWNLQEFQIQFETDYAGVSELLRRYLCLVFNKKTQLMVRIHTERP